MKNDIIDSPEAFKKELLELVGNIVDAERANSAMRAQEKDGKHRCYRCGDLMCETTEPKKVEGEDRYIVGARYYQCFTNGCNMRKEFII